MDGEKNRSDFPKRELNTGEEVPCIGMGTFGSDKYSPRQVSDAVYGAIACGYRLFDCAAVYGNEAQIGAVFQRAFRESLVKRDELHIISKVWNDMHGKGQVISSLKQSLRDLQLDYIDTFFIHWPFPNYHAPGCAGDARNPDSKPFFAEDFMIAWRQMEQLHREGLVRNIGMSNMTIPKLQVILPLCEIVPAMMEMELHPSFQQPELFDYVVRLGILPIGFCPIGSPSRPERDKFPGDVTDTELPAITSAAKRRNIHPALICLKWAVQKGAVPIPFSVDEKKYRANLSCFAEEPLTEAEMKAIEQSDVNCRLVKGQVFLWEGAESWKDLWDPEGYIVEGPECGA